ncbi:MAG: zinc finger domain-containing protein [Candidatus Micrarchaeia archaeon]|jgi:predicted RNA-binding Zn-ribbon protein involved in translation (DUF1610 family)
MKTCSSCGSGTNDYVTFKCPSCGKETVIRCAACRKNNTRYICKCGFRGP